MISPVRMAMATASTRPPAPSFSISDATWNELASHYDERQLIELPMLVGHYHLVAYTLNSLGVQREPGVPGFDG